MADDPSATAQSADGDGGTDSAAISDSDGAADPGDESAAAGDAGGRSVVVPDRVYKAVTVFSTLIAIVTIVGGFVVLDRATNRATAPLDEIDPVLALVGIGLILLGAVTYAFSTRFRAAGMGNAKGDTAENSDNG